MNKDVGTKGRASRSKPAPVAGMASGIGSGGETAPPVAARRRTTPDAAVGNGAANGGANGGASWVANGGANGAETAVPEAGVIFGATPGANGGSAATITALQAQIARTTDIGRRLEAAGSPLARYFANQNPEEAAAYLLREHLDGLESSMAALQLA